MFKFFGLPIFTAIVLGTIFPYTALTLAPYGIIFLVILMISAGLVIDWTSTVRITSRLPELTIGLLFVFVIYPCLLWVPAHFLISDQQYLYGFIFASLCPIALVAPYFSRIHGADSDYATLLVICSMILCPILAPLILSLLFSSSISLNLVPLTRYMLLLVTVPLVIAFIIGRYLPSIRSRVLKIDGYINSVALALLVFALFGAAVGKVNTSYIDSEDVAGLLLMVFLQDFAVLILARYLCKEMLENSTRMALVISSSMKNVAIAAGVLLVYDPKASLAPALAFLAHGCLFSLLAYPKVTKRLFGTSFDN